MKTSTAQSAKARNARLITELQVSITMYKLTARELYNLAHEQMRCVKDTRQQIKKLAKEQINIKSMLKGPPKAKRVAKPDSRPKAMIHNLPEVVQLVMAPIHNPAQEGIGLA